MEIDLATGREVREWPRLEGCDFEDTGLFLDRPGAGEGGEAVIAAPLAASWTYAGRGVRFFDPNLSAAFEEARKSILRLSATRKGSRTGTECGRGSQKDEEETADPALEETGTCNDFEVVAYAFLTYNIYIIHIS